MNLAFVAQARPIHRNRILFDQGDAPARSRQLESNGGTGETTSQDRDLRV